MRLEEEKVQLKLFSGCLHYEWRTGHSSRFWPSQRHVQPRPSIKSDSIWFLREQTGKTEWISMQAYRQIRYIYKMVFDDKWDESWWNRQLLQNKQLLWIWLGLYCLLSTRWHTCSIIWWQSSYLKWRQCLIGSWRQWRHLWIDEE